jgi:hypothetical protein
MSRTLIRAILISGIVVSGLAPVAWAHHGPQGPLDRVRVLADQVEDSSDRLLYLAERTMPRYGFRQGRSLHAVRTLAREAEDFERQVRRIRPSRAATERDFLRLLDALDRASFSLSRARTSWLVRNELARVQALVRKLDRSYGYLVASVPVRFGRYQEGARHGRYLARWQDDDLDEDDFEEIDTVVRHRRGPGRVAVRIDD